MSRLSSAVYLLVAFAAAGCSGKGTGKADLSPSAVTPTAQMQSVLGELNALNGKPIPTLSPQEARQQPTPTDAVMKLKNKLGKPLTPPPGIAVSQTKVGAVLVRVYTPEGGTSPKPVIVYVHGGGWVIATLDTYDGSARALAMQTKSIVLSVDYRQAPEHKFPAAHEDVYAVLQWALVNAKEVGGDTRSVAIAGESAGGNMATAACLMAIDRKGKLPVHQLLVYPVANYAFDTPSYQTNADAKPLNKAMMAWFFEKYLNSPAEGQNKYVSPLRASNDDLAKLPPATVITASIDPLQSEGKAYADKLSSSGVKVAYRNYDGVTHEFFGMADVVDEAKAAQAFASSQLTKAFERK